jgi:hypothetical protein
MKQPSNKHTHTPTPSECLVALGRRQLMSRLVMGGAAALVLSACGGGGSSDSSSESKDLEAAYYRLKDGMTWEEAKAAVGWEPNDGDRSWYDSGFLLACSIEYRSSVGYLGSAGLSGNGIRVSHVFFVE